MCMHDRKNTEKRDKEGKHKFVNTNFPVILEKN